MNIQKNDKVNAWKIRECANCATVNTPMWRRDTLFQWVCNACGLYSKLNGINRSITLRKDFIKTRQRKKKSSMQLMSGPVNPEIITKDSYEFRNNYYKRLRESQQKYQAFAPGQSYNSYLLNLPVNRLPPEMNKNLIEHKVEHDNVNNAENRLNKIKCSVRTTNASKIVQEFSDMNSDISLTPIRSHVITNSKRVSKQFLNSYLVFNSHTNCYQPRST